MKEIIDYTGLKFTFLAPTTIKSTNNEKEWIVRGYAATIDLDRQGDVISIEALRKAADDLKTNTTIFYEHQYDKPPVGKILDTGVDTKGLWVEVLISQTRPDMWQLINEGILSNFSIGGKVKRAVRKYDKERKRTYNNIVELDLLEVSIVGLPANPKAQFSCVKSITAEIEKAYIMQNKLKDALNEIKGGQKDMTEPVKKDDKKIDINKAAVDPETSEPKPQLTKDDIKNLVKSDKPNKKKDSKDVKDDEEYYYIEEELAKDFKTIKDTMNTLVEIVKDIQTRLKNIETTKPAVIKSTPEKIDYSKIDKSVKEAIETVKKSIPTVDNIETVIKKNLEEKLGRIRLVPSRKGTIVKLLKDENQENSEDMEALFDEGKFNTLNQKQQKEVIRKGLLAVITKRS